MKMITVLLLAAGAQCDRDTPGPLPPAPVEYHQCVNNGRIVWDGCERHPPVVFP